MKTNFINLIMAGKAMKNAGRSPWVSRGSSEGRQTRFARIAAVLLMLLTMSVGEVWGWNTGFENGNNGVLMKRTPLGGVEDEYKPIHGRTNDVQNAGTVSALVLKEYFCQMYQDVDELSGQTEFGYWHYRTKDGRQGDAITTDKNWEYLGDWNSAGWRYPKFGRNGMNVNLVAGKGSGIYTFEYYFRGKEKGDYWHICNNNGNNFKINSTILPPAIDNYAVAASGWISGSGTEGDPYVVPKGQNICFTTSGNQNHEDANSTIRTVVTLSGSSKYADAEHLNYVDWQVNSTDKISLNVKAHYWNQTDDIQGAESSQTIWVKAADPMVHYRHADVDWINAPTKDMVWETDHYTCTFDDLAAGDYEFDIPNKDWSTLYKCTSTNAQSPIERWDETNNLKFTLTKPSKVVLTLTKDSEGGAKPTLSADTTHLSISVSGSMDKDGSGNWKMNAMTNPGGNTYTCTIDGLAANSYDFNFKDRVDHEIYRWNSANMVVDNSPLELTDLNNNFKFSLTEESNVTFTLTFNVDGTKDVRVSAIPVAATTYLIRFKNGETVLQEGQVEKGQTPAYNGETPTKASTAEFSYLFTDWSPALYAADKDQNYVAQFSETRVPYTLTWDFAGGQTATPEGNYTHGLVDNGATITAPANPTKTGYNFTGWNVTPASNMPTANTTYTAQWTPITYTVAYNANGGTGSMASTNHTYDADLALNTNNDAITKAGYLFAGWDTDEAGTNVVYTNGQSVSNLTTTNGATVNLYAVWKERFALVGSAAEQDDPLKGMPGWTDATSTANFVYSDGTYFLCELDLEASTKYKFMVYDRKNSTRRGCSSNEATLPINVCWTFNGAGNGTHYSATLTTNHAGKYVLSLKIEDNDYPSIKWYDKKYDVTVNDGDHGTVSPNGTVQAGAMGVQLTVTPATGYNHTGWGVSGGATVSNESGKLYATADGTATAIYTANHYSIAFDGNGATVGSMSSMDVAYDARPSLSVNAFAKTGYTFAGWSITKDGDVVYADQFTLTEALSSEQGATITLYAKWTWVGALNFHINDNDWQQMPMAKNGNTFTYTAYLADGEYEFNFQKGDADLYNYDNTLEHTNISRWGETSNCKITLSRPSKVIFTLTEGTEDEWRPTLTASVPEPLTLYLDGSMNSWSHQEMTYDESNNLYKIKLNGVPTGDSDFAIKYKFAEDVYRGIYWFDTPKVNHPEGTIVLTDQEDGQGHKNFKFNLGEASDLNFTLEFVGDYQKNMRVSRPYAIIYKDQDNADFSGSMAGLPTTHNYGTETTLVAPTRAGYAFLGWYSDAACTQEAIAIPYNCMESKTFYAKWAQIGFYLNIGTQDVADWQTPFFTNELSTSIELDGSHTYTFSIKQMTAEGTTVWWKNGEYTYTETGAHTLTNADLTADGKITTTYSGVYTFALDAATPTSLTVTYPSFDCTFTQGKEHNFVKVANTITFEPSSIGLTIASYKYYLSDQNGANYVDITRDVSTNTYTWTPTDAGTGYKFKIEALAGDGSTVLASKESDAISVYAPTISLAASSSHSDGKFYPNSTITITPTINNAPVGAQMIVCYSYVEGGDRQVGTDFETIAETNSVHALGATALGNYQVTATLKYGNACETAVEVASVTEPASFTVLDNYLTLTPNSVNNVGGDLVLTAETNLDNPSYSFTVLRPGESQPIQIGTTNPCNYTLPMAGTYEFRVHATEGDVNLDAAIQNYAVYGEQLYMRYKFLDGNNSRSMNNVKLSYNDEDGTYFYYQTTAETVEGWYCPISSYDYSECHTAWVGNTNPNSDPETGWKDILNPESLPNSTNAVIFHYDPKDGRIWISAATPHYRVKSEGTNGTFYSNAVSGANQEISFYASTDATLSWQKSENGLGSWTDYGTICTKASANGIYSATPTAINNGANTLELSKYAGALYVYSEAVDDKVAMTSFTGNTYYDNYRVTWAPMGTDVGAMVGNNINRNIAVLLPQYILPNNTGDPETAGANVRYSYDSETNFFSRSFVAGSTAGDFLKIYGQNLTTHTTVGTDLTMDDGSNWVYNATVEATKEGDTYANAHIVAKYNGYETWLLAQNGTEANSQPITFLGAGCTNGIYTMKVIYDFKTNKLESGWVPSGDVASNVSVNNMLVTRTDDGPTTEFIIGNSASAIALDHMTTEFIITKDMWTRWSGSSEIVRENDQDVTYKTLLFWISLPYQCKVSDIYGFGKSNVNWEIQRYRGDKRDAAAAGSGWRALTVLATMNANEGYVLSVRLKAGDFVAFNETEQLCIYFPSASSVTLTHAPVQTLTAYVSNPSPIQRDWHVMGVPVMKSGRKMVETGQPAAPFEFVYKWTWADGGRWYEPIKIVETSSGDYFNFLAGHAYMVQGHGDLTWNYEVAGSGSPINAPVRANALTAKDFRIDLMAEDEMLDKTYVLYRSNGSRNYEIGRDLEKILNPGRSMIYSELDQKLAAICLSDEDEVQIPLTVVAAESGEYTLQLPAPVSGVEPLLYDAQEGTTTMLNHAGYTIELAAGTYEGRFFLGISTVPGISTEMGNTSAGQESNTIMKFIDQNDRLIILKGGKCYDAQGRLVK